MILQAHNGTVLGRRTRDPEGNDQPRYGIGREHRRHDADAQRHGKAAHRAGPHAEQDHGGNQRGDVGIKNGAKRHPEAGLDGIQR